MGEPAGRSGRGLLCVPTFDAVAGCEGYSGFEMAWRMSPAVHVSWAEARQLFRKFRRVHIERQNSQSFLFLRGRPLIPPEMLLNNLGGVLGFDLYLYAYK